MFGHDDGYEADWSDEDEQPSGVGCDAPAWSPGHTAEFVRVMVCHGWCRDRITLPESMVRGSVTCRCGSATLIAMGLSGCNGGLERIRPTGHVCHCDYCDDLTTYLAGRVQQTTEEAA